MFLEIKKLVFVARGAHGRKRLGRAIAIGGTAFAVGAALAFGLLPGLRERVAHRFRPKPASKAEPRVADGSQGATRCEGSPPSAWEPEQDGDG